MFSTTVAHLHFFVHPLLLVQLELDMRHDLQMAPM